MVLGQGQVELLPAELELLAQLCLHPGGELNRFVALGHGLVSTPLQGTAALLHLPQQPPLLGPAGLQALVDVFLLLLEGVEALLAFADPGAFAWLPEMAADSLFHVGPIFRCPPACLREAEVPGIVAAVLTGVVAVAALANVVAGGEQVLQFTEGGFAAAHHQPQLVAAAGAIKVPGEGTGHAQLLQPVAASGTSVAIRAAMSLGM